MEGDSMSTEIGTLEELGLDTVGSVGIVGSEMINIQVATAKKWPRSITRALEEAETLACQDEKTAETMYYVLPRSGDDIIGPSARLAEVMSHVWGNLIVAAEPLDEGRTHLVAEGTCWDMERNVACRIRVKRRITKSSGKRYSDDMIGQTANAAVSIAFRNAVFKAIPRVYVDRIYRKAMAASVGNLDTVAAKRTAAMEYFGGKGYQPEQIYALLKVEGLEDIGVEEIIRLRGIVNAVKQGDATLEGIFNPPKGEEATQELDKALTPDALAGIVPSGKYRGQTYHQALADTDAGPEYVRRYLLPKAIGDLREQLEAALLKIENGGEPETSSSNALDAGEMPKEEAGAVGGASPVEELGDQPESIVDEAYRKASAKASTLSVRGELSVDEALRLDELHSAKDFEGLLELEKDFDSRLSIIADAGGGS